MKIDYPRIVTKLGNEYIPLIEKILSHSLPPHLLNNKGADFIQRLPMLSWSRFQDPPFVLTFYVCVCMRKNVVRFFTEMLSRWLLPGRLLNVEAQLAIDFQMPEVIEETLTVGELSLFVGTDEDLVGIQKNLSALEAELRIGMLSPYQAHRIMELKGLSFEEKTTAIQETMIQLVHRRPQDFDYDILPAMQTFLVLGAKEFKVERDAQHLSRIITVHYLFHKTLKLSLEVFPDRRYISVKLFRDKLSSGKRVVGIVIGISYVDENEFFQKKHILNGIQTLCSSARFVEGSFYQRKAEPIVLVYLEIESLILAEEKRLKEELPQELKLRIEKPLSPIFMPQNEEEIMRNILALADQLKYVRDLPQVMVSFVKQIEEKLEFRVIWVRVKQGPSLHSLMEAKPTFLEYLPDRVRVVGRLRKKYLKEASVFRLRIQKKLFLRRDHSVDLYKARLEVVSELIRILGEFRDYNGGTLSKETELFAKVRHQLGSKISSHAFLLENYFYALQPAVMRSVLSPAPIVELFEMILQAQEIGVDENQRYTIQMHEHEQHFFLLVTSEEKSFHETLFSSLKPFCQHSFQVATCAVSTANYFCFGLIMMLPSEDEIHALKLTVEQAMTEWSDRLLTLP